MTQALRFAAVRRYQASSAAIAADASPHRQVAMLYEGALERLNFAISAVNQHDLQAKLRSVDAALGIISYLRAVIDMKSGGEIAKRLGLLYDYMQKRTLQANLHNDAAGFREVADLLRTIKSGWDQIAPELH